MTCPLGNRTENTWQGIPTACAQNCWAAMDDVLGTAPTAENYDPCGHDVMLDVSAEKVRAIGGTAQREYVIVEECQECNVEVLDTSYQFICVAG